MTAPKDNHIKLSKVKKSATSESAGEMIEKTAVRRRGKRIGANYSKSKKMVDRGKSYSVGEAVALLVKTAWANFNESAEAHLEIRQDRLSVRVSFPHSQGKSRIIAVADDKEVMAKIEAGDINFDILLASPKVMPKLIPYARILGPRGLMPNPKEGTITADPERKAKELAGLGMVVKTEKKAPLIHTVFGRVKQGPVELEENLEALIKAVGRQNFKKMVISATMGPGIVVKVSE